MFARRMQKHPYMKAFILNRDKVCQWCGYRFKGPPYNFHIHHIDYDHECQFEHMVEIIVPTSKRPEKKRELPDCERCHKKDFIFF